ncbi:hypothetical protein M1446_02790 [Candidatus Dependentiae bacterium]|nr:hypothetical protein [Candidatus Dependentiae bacterium]
MKKLFLIILCSQNLFAMQQPLAMQSNQSKEETSTVSEISFENIITQGSSEPTGEEILANLDKLLKKRNEYLQNKQITMDEVMNTESGVTKKMIAELSKLYLFTQLDNLNCRKLNEDQAFYIIACCMSQIKQAVGSMFKE